MNPDTPADELTPDDILLGSLSYRGYSSRFEMWILLIVMCAAYVPLMLLHTLGLVLLLLFYVLCVWPLYVRRARQMGSVGYGVFIVGLCTLEVLFGLIFHLLGRHEQLESLKYWAAFTTLLMLPLYLVGGTYSGKKTALMRAAIGGNPELVRQLAEQNPQGIWLISERGHRAGEYADMLGHKAVADYLHGLEERHISTNHLPSAKDISPFGTLDEETAKRDFLGKTQEQAARLFYELAEYYLEGVFWMGDKGFIYYLPAVIPFMESEESKMDSDFVRSLLLTIKNRLEESPQAVRACRREVLHILRYLCAHWEKYGIDDEAAELFPPDYDPRERGEKLLAAVEAMEEA